MLLNLGIRTSEKLALIADSLVNLQDSLTRRDFIEWKKEIEYFANKFVATFAKLDPFNHKIVKKVDLSFLSPVILALLFGNRSERNTAREMLLTLQGCLRENETEVRIHIADWLSRTKESIPRVLSRLKDFENIITLKLIKKKGIFSEIPESMKYIDILIKILVGLVGIIGAIYAVIQFLFA
jgi:hypothetical protein